MAGSFLGGLTGGAIGSAVVRLVLDDSQYTAGLAQAKGEAVSSTSAMGASFSKFKLLAGAALGVVAVGLGRFAGQAIEAASAQEEALNKARVVFGATSAEVEAFAETAADSYGIAETAALDAAGGFGTMLQTAGLTQDAAGEMSVSLVQLAGDLSSFYDLATDDALLKLRSGLAGEAEPLRQLGVLLSEARVKSEAYASGIAKAGAELTEAQKVQARYNLILKDTRLAQGDAARTSNSLANQQRRLTAQFRDFAADVGQELLPVVSELAGDLLELGRDVAPVVVEQLGRIAENIRAIIDLKNQIGTGEGFFPDGFFDVDLPGGGGSGFLGGWFSDIASAGDDFFTGTVGDWFGNLLDSGKVLADRLGDVFTGDEFVPDHLEDQLGSLADRTDDVAESSTEAAAAGRNFADAEGDVQAESEKTEDQIRDEARAHQELFDARLSLAGGTLGLLGAVKDYRDAVRETERLERAGKEGTEEHTDANIEALESYLTLREQLQSYRQELRESGLQQSEVRTQLREWAAQMGINKGELREMLGPLSSVRDRLSVINSEMDSLDGRRINATVNVTVTNMSDLLLLKHLQDTGTV